MARVDILKDLWPFMAEKVSHVADNAPAAEKLSELPSLTARRASVLPARPDRFSACI